MVTSRPGWTSPRSASPADADSIAFSRSAGQVLNIAYLNPAAVTEGGFFPAGVNGEINTSAANG